MPGPVRERLRELQADVQDLKFRPAAEVRARGRQRGRRRMTALVVAGAVVATTVGIVATGSRDRPDRQAAAPVEQVPCVLALPNDPAEVRIRILGGGASAGLPATADSQLRARRFTVVGTGDGDPVGVPTVRYGPAAIGAATLVRAEVHGEVLMRFDPTRRDDRPDPRVGLHPVRHHHRGQ